jgi:hypothetical protein
MCPPDFFLTLSLMRSHILLQAVWEVSEAGFLILWPSAGRLDRSNRQERRRNLRSAGISQAVAGVQPRDFLRCGDKILKIHRRKTNAHKVGDIARQRRQYGQPPGERPLTERALLEILPSECDVDRGWGSSPKRQHFAMLLLQFSLECQPLRRGFDRRRIVIYLGARGLRVELIQRRRDALDQIMRSCLSSSRGPFLAGPVSVTAFHSFFERSFIPVIILWLCDGRQ